MHVRVSSVSSTGIAKPQLKKAPAKTAAQALCFTNRPTSVIFIVT